MDLLRCRNIKFITNKKLYMGIIVIFLGLVIFGLLKWGDSFKDDGSDIDDYEL